VNGILPTTLGGVSVTNAVVTTTTGVSAPGVVTLAPVAPGLFMSGQYAAAQLSNYSAVGTANPAYSIGVAFSGAFS
jgi:uncharacterized protein (TIGR03437 family)